MQPEVLVGVLAVFVSGGALGIGGTLCCQWAHRKLSWKPYQTPPLEGPELVLLRSDVADLNRTVLDLSERLEFQERLLAGGSPQKLQEPHPEPDPAPEPDPEPESGPSQDSSSSQDPGPPPGPPGP